MARVDGALPTLLGSRSAAMNEPTKRRRPTPAALELPEESTLSSAPGLRIKNTFIERVALLSPSLETFYQERIVHTCPSKHVGRCISLLEELAREVPNSPVCTPLNLQTPCGIRTPLGHAWVQRQACHGWCEPPFVYPSYAHLGHVDMFSDIPMSAAPVPPAAQSSSQRVGGESRTVLSLAVALEQEVIEDASPPHDFSGFVSVCPATQRDVLESAPQYEAPQVEESTRVSKPPVGPALGSPELPSVGSAGHAAGRCKPCAFVHSKGCENDLACPFCHLCGPEAKKARRQEKLQLRREANRAKKEREAVRHCRSI